MLRIRQETSCQMDHGGRSQMCLHRVFCDVAGRRHMPGYMKVSC